MTGAELQEIILEDLHDSPWNPRIRYNPTEIEQLAASMRAQGQLTPIVVRPRKKGGFEIGAGHCRLRAARLAGLTVLEARVRDLDDAAFLELLNTENLARNDLHPLEEAQGFKGLMEHAGYDIDRLAHRIGRSQDYVYDRLKLLQLIQPARELFLERQIPTAHAVLLARLSAVDQKRAIGNITTGHGESGGLFEYDRGAAYQGEFKLPVKQVLKPTSLKEFQTWIDRNVRARPDGVDGFLFPETAEALAQAAATETKVVSITFEFVAPHATRDPNQRTYGYSAWKRADGRDRSKVCDHSVIGLVVGGRRRNEAFRVCIARDKCLVHWREQAQRAAKRAKAMKRTAGKPKTQTASAPVKPAEPEGPPSDRYEKELERRAPAEPEGPPSDRYEKELERRAPAEVKRIVTIGAAFKDVELIWNLARSVTWTNEFEQWYQAGTTKTVGGVTGDEALGIHELRDYFQALLPGRTSQRARDIAGARAEIALEVWLARDSEEFVVQLNKAVEEAWAAEQAAKRAEAKKAPKPPARKGGRK